MKTHRIRLTRLVREDIELVVHFTGQKKLGSYDAYDELFDAARRAGHTVNVHESFDAISQYGYIHPDDEPADITVSNDGILVNPQDD